MNKKLLEIAAEIVHAQSAANRMSPDEIELALMKTFATLQKMQKAEEEGVLLKTVADAPVEEKPAESIDPKQSIRDDKVVCLECGAEMRQLTVKHLSSHNLTPRDYKKKWGFPLKQSLSAKILSKARSRAAKKRGLPENLVKYLEERRQKRFDAMSLEGAAAIVNSEERHEPKATKRPRKRKSD
jgi:predicted transcriptional regulator